MHYCIVLNTFLIQIRFVCMFHITMYNVDHHCLHYGLYGSRHNASAILSGRAPKTRNEPQLLQPRAILDQTKRASVTVS